MKNKSYFYTKTNGLNADIERHREEEQKIIDKINKLESIDNKSKFDIMSLRAYKNFLYQLQDSKAEVVSKIGKK